MSTYRKRQAFTLAAALCLHWVWLQFWPAPLASLAKVRHMDAPINTHFSINVVSVLLGESTVGPSPYAPHTSQTNTNLPVDHQASVHAPPEYRSSDQLDTRAAPRLEWNIDKQSISHSGPTSLVFTVWVSENGTIETLEPHTFNEQPWQYDSLAQALQTTPMVPASLRTVPVASTMTVELMLNSDD